MKPSFYNLFFEENDNAYVVNTMSGGIIQLPKNASTSLADGKVESIDRPIVDELYAQGFIVDSGCDELKNYLDYYEEKKNPGGQLDIQLFLAKSCNLSCPYCYQRAFNKPVNIISENKLIAFSKYIHKQIKENGFKNVNIQLFGGEPLLAKSRLGILFSETDKLEKMFNATISYSITTNATLFDDNILNDLLKRKAWIQITLDGPKEIHDARRFWKNGKGSYEKIVESVKKIVEQGGANDLLMRVNIDRENISALPSVLDTLKEIGVLQVECGLVEFKEGENEYESQRIKGGEEVIWETEMFAFEELKKRGFNNSPVDFTMKTVCSLHRNNSFVFDTNLQAFKCDMLIENPKYAIGHISDSGEMIISGDEYSKQTSRKPTDFKSCSTCRFLPVCGSGCAAKALNTNGELHSNYCEASMQSIQLKLKSYISASHN